eukprot:scaffold89447_cov59-Phaeocystis_antarctica.AAC.3
MPYDQTTFGKFHMWQSVLLLAIAASPVWYLRATFFTLFLGCLMRDMEEFQFVRFILGLKVPVPCSQSEVEPSPARCVPSRRPPPPASRPAPRPASYALLSTLGRARASYPASSRPSRSRSTYGNAPCSSP